MCPFLLTCNLSLYFVEILIPQCAYRPWSHFIFWVTNVSKSWYIRVEPCFWGAFSYLCFLFNILRSYRCQCLSPPPPQAPRRRRWPSRCGRPRPLGGWPRAPVAAPQASRRVAQGLGLLSLVSSAKTLKSFYKSQCVCIV